MTANVFHRLSAAFGFPVSERLPRLLAMLMAEEEAQVLLAFPGTPACLAERLGVEPERLAAQLDDLYRRGLAFIGAHTAEGPRYELIDAGRFMDSVLFDPSADRLGEAYFDLWSQFAHQELWPATGHQSWNFRVLPIGGTIRLDSRILPHEEAVQIVHRARRIAVQQCACRKRERKCDHPIEACLSFDELAEYVLYRQAGREIDADEALAILGKCAERGLIHQTANTDGVDVICNCCNCCCGVLTPLLRYGMDQVVSRSRFASAVDPELCVDCLACVDPCWFGALQAVDGKLVPVPENCYGCGKCVTVCPVGAITLVEARGPDHIPLGQPGFSLSRLPPGGGSGHHQG
jgi:electron transport complex protein RnfB